MRSSVRGIAADCRVAGRSIWSAAFVASGEPMSEAGAEESHVRAIRLWLVAIAALLVAMVLVGGATRLTESGLSIVEWQPVTGTLPPLSAQAWQTEFDKYRATPQYRHLNAGMSLDAFQVIYWWEWTHRLLGRVIGAAFLLPFLFFLWRGWVAPRLAGGWLPPAW
jgi:cytochrome c oxidase assembly protein subunit 15